MDENHLIDIVDESDNVIGQAIKEEKFAKELISRNVVAFIKNKKGELIIVKRSPKKRSWPNRLDLATCGNVDAGESYEEAIKREVLEEIGIECKLKFIKKLFNDVIENGKHVRYFTGTFAGVTDEKPVLSDELLELRYIKIDKLKKHMREKPDDFSPSFVSELMEIGDLV